MNETNETESKSNESAQQSAEKSKKIEELTNKKVEEILQRPYAKVINLTKEEVSQDWKVEEIIYKKSGKTFNNIEELIKSIYNSLEVKYSNMVLRYKEYAVYRGKTAEHAIIKFLENPEENYLVPGLGIERGQIIELYGAPGAGKTFLSLEMAYKMAIGGWILNTPEYAVTKPLKVLYVDNENGRTLIRRLYRMELYEVGLANENLYLIQNGGVLSKDGTKEEYLPSDWFGKDPQDKNAKSLTDAIIGMIKTGGVPKPDVVFIDPLADVMLGDENSTEDMKNFVVDIKDLIKYTGAAVIINHHVNKGDTQGGVYKSRGSSVLPGALDMAVELRAKEEDIGKKAGKNKKTGKKKPDEKGTEPKEPEDNKGSEDQQKNIGAMITKPNRNGTKVFPFSYGVFDTLIDDLKVDIAGKNISGIVNSKIYGTATARARLRAEMIALMYHQSSFLHQPSLKPATISYEEYEEKIKSIIKKYPNAYDKDANRIDEAYKEFKGSKNIKKEEETSNHDN